MRNMTSISLFSILYSLFNAVAVAEQPATAPELEGGFYGSVGTFYATPSTNGYANSNNNLRAPSSDLGISNNGINANSGGNYGMQGTVGYVFPNTSNGAEISTRSFQ